MPNEITFPRIALRIALNLAVLGVIWGGGVAVGDDDAPTIDKNSIHIMLQAGREGAFEKPGWVPGIEYRVNGPIASGSQLSVEFSLPGKNPWLTFDCRTGEIEKGHAWKTSCGGGNISNDQAVVYTGPLGFTIHLRNELSGTNLTLFTGKAKVGRNPAPANSGPNYHWTASEFYVDDDWRIPIAYVFFTKDSGHLNQSFLHVGFWYRGNPPEIEAHLFYKGKDIAKYNQAGNGAGDWIPNKHQWGFADCQFLGVYRNLPSDGQGYDPKFALASNPGDYEVKALIVGHLARSIKFTVDADGKFDNGIASANKLGINRVIVPAQVLGNQSTWDKTAWKTDAFYGNPLTGFTPAP
jgi:hypothetical protein